jgi:hypothetical protein
MFINNEIFVVVGVVNPVGSLTAFDQKKPTTPARCIA